MRAFAVSSLCLLVSVLLLVVKAEEGAYEADGPVKILTAENFDSVLAEHKLALIEFYAPWCGHCKMLKPEYEKVAEEFKGNDKGILIAAVDANTEKELGNKFGVKGFPTIKLFRNGEFSADFNGGRTADDIIAYVNKQSLPACSVWEKEKDVRDVLEKQQIVVIGYFSSQGNRDTFHGLADKLRDGKAIFGEITDKKTAKKFGLEKSPSIKIFRKFDEPEVAFTGTFDAEHVTQFVKENSFPLFAELGPDNYEEYTRRNLPFFWVFQENKGESDADKEYTEVVLSVVKKYAKKFSFVHINGPSYQRYADELGIKSFPSAVILKDEDVYTFEGKEFNKKSVEKWLQSYVDGKLKPRLKSEPEPESNDGPVKVVVGTNFKQVVLDSEDSVLVEFYAPWCGHCKQLAPIWDELGELASNSKGITIAKIDATANTFPKDNVNVEGFPTIYLYKKGHKNEPIRFDGGRTLKDFISFIKKNTGVTIKDEVNVEKLLKKLDDLDAIKKLTQKLIEENAELRSELEEREEEEEKEPKAKSKTHEEL